MKAKNNKLVYFYNTKLHRFFNSDIFLIIFLGVILTFGLYLVLNVTK